MIGERDIIRPLGMHGRRALRERLLRIGHCGQNVIIHFDELGGVAREVAVARHDHRDRMADEVNAVGRENVVLGHAQVGHRNAARHNTNAFRVLASENADDTGSGFRLLGLDRPNTRCGVRAAQNYGVMHPRHLDVFHIGGRAGDEPRVFAAANALANKSFGFGGGSGHGRLLLSRAGRGGLHRVDDVLVSGAATHVALQAVANLIFGG